MNRPAWRRLRAELWQPPRAHGEERRDRSVGPLELFYDLVVVVLVAQAAHSLAGDLTAAGVGRFGAVFAIVWIAWFNGTLHHELHGREDVRARNTFLGQILLLVPLGAFIPAADSTHGRAFSIDSALLFGFLAFLWWRAGRNDDADFARTTRFYVWATLLTAVALAGSAALSAEARIVAWGGIGGLYLAVIVGIFAAAPARAVSSLAITDALLERFGAFVIIVLGETVTGVVTGLAGRPTRAIDLAVGLAAILVGFGSWWTYFDFAGHRQPRETRAAALAWMFGHLPISAAIAAMGAAMGPLVEHAGAARTGVAVSWALSGGAIVMLTFTAVQLTCLPTWRSERTRYGPLALACLLATIPAAIVGWLHPRPLVLALVLVLSFSGPWLFALLRRVPAVSPTPDLD